MIKILICDDDKHLCSYMEKNIMDWAATSQCAVNIDQCYSGKSFRQYIEKEEHPDILFLDIELGDETGMQLGEYVREYLKDENLQIVFVSSHTEYAMELFQLRPFNFLEKPVKMAALRQVMLKYCEIKLCAEKKYFIYQQKQNAHRIDLEEIIYFQSDRKKIRILINNQEEFNEYYGNLEEAMQQLDQERFWCIHKSYIVNVKYVKSFGRTQFILRSGEEIPVSRSRWKVIRQWILQHRDV